MGRFYGIKINNNDMMLENVPKLWMEATEKWLNENT